MLPFAPKFLRQVRLSGSPTRLGSDGPQTVQDLRDLMPKGAKRINPPEHFYDLSVGDYIIAPDDHGGYILYRVFNQVPTTASGPSNLTEVEVLASIGDPTKYNGVGYKDAFYSKGKPTDTEVYSTSASNTPLIIGGLALAAVIGSAIYFSTRR